MSLEKLLDATVGKAMEEKRIVGAVLLVRRHGELIHEAAYGLADREAGRPMAVDAIFRLSSLTKPIVATTILAMVDAGLIGLDNPVTDYLPYFTPRLADGSTPVITIRHLLTHTAGLGGEIPVSEAEQQDPDFNRWHLSLDENMERLASMPLLFAPGTSWAYSLSIDVLGAIAGKLVGGTLGDAVEKYVTGPLRMDDTAFRVTDRARLAAAYADGADGPVLMGDPHSVPSPWGGDVVYSPGRILDAKAYHSGGGGMAGSARDYMKLLEALRTDGGAVLKPETLALGLANQTPQLAQSVSPGWQFGFFGAWLADPALAASPANMGTSRWGGIYGHTWFIDPKAGLSVVSMTNTGLEGCDRAYPLEVRDAIYAGVR